MAQLSKHGMELLSSWLYLEALADIQHPLLSLSNAPLAIGEHEAELTSKSIQ
jgi:hypothetical protein